MDALERAATTKAVFSLFTPLVREFSIIHRESEVKLTIDSEVDWKQHIFMKKTFCHYLTSQIVTLAPKGVILLIYLLLPDRVHNTTAVEFMF